MTNPATADICAHVVDEKSLPTTVYGRVTTVTECQTTQQAITSEKWLEAPDKFREEVLTVEEWGDIEVGLDAQNTSKVFNFDSAEGVSVMTSSLIERVVSEAFDVSNEGAATVTGRDCHVLFSTPTDRADVLSSRIDTYRLWVDQDCGYPLKQKYEYQFQERALVVRRESEEIGFDNEIVDDVFENTGNETLDLSGWTMKTKQARGTLLPRGSSFPPAKP